MKKFTTSKILSVAWIAWGVMFIIDWVRYGGHAQETNSTFIVWVMICFVSIIYNKLDAVEKKLTDNIS